MKLLKCHIDNFGKLSDYELTFNTGLTVIREPNGFGKSTLAAFIKAMFYGFPRIGARNKIENERKRYEPWNGGKYGGYIEFEFEKTEYRVTRVFGKTTAKDTFSLFDLTNRRESGKFSEKIGEELFQLDAESFTRSTYMPQISEKNTDATTSIRAKLNNLVDNTNDINNYDSAKGKLRSIRTRYRNYRGNGGEIQDLQKQIEEINGNLESVEIDQGNLQQVIEDIDLIIIKQKKKKEEIDELRESMRKSSEQNMIIMQKKDIDEIFKKLTKIDDKYANGYPEKEEIRNQQVNLEQIKQKTEELERMTLPKEICKAVEEGKELFADQIQTEKDINIYRQRCNELAEIKGKLAASGVSENVEKKKQLLKMFEEGIPSNDELKIYQEKANDLVIKERDRKTAEMSLEEQAKLNELKNFFVNGMPEEGELEICAERQERKRNVLIPQRDSLSLESEEQEELKKLAHYFAIKIPSEKEIFQKQQEYHRVVELKGKKNVQTTIVQQQESEPQESKTWFFLGVFGIILLLVGIVCFSGSMLVGGAILFAFGLGALVVAFWMHTKQMSSRVYATPTVVKGSAITDTENQELYTLQRNINEFIQQFYPSVSAPGEQLSELLVDRKRFVKLLDKQKRIENQIKEKNEEISKLEEPGRRLFERFYPGKMYCDDFVSDLRKKVLDYRTLVEREKKLAVLGEEIKEIDSELKNVLRRYYGDSYSENMQTAVMQLNTDINAYVELQDRTGKIQHSIDETSRKNIQLEELLEKILKKYEVNKMEESYDRSLQILQEKFVNYKEALKKVKQFESEEKEAKNIKKSAEESFEKFLEKYKFECGDQRKLLDDIENDIKLRQILSGELQKKEKALMEYRRDNLLDKQDEVEGGYVDLKFLQQKESKKEEELGEIEKELSGLRKKREELQANTEKIAEWRDQVARLKEEKEDKEKRCSLLDKTIELLDQAKDNLSFGYVGKVERGFKNYAEQLLDDMSSHAMVDRNLKIYIDEQGMQREAGYYSVGTIDSIMICMRLALIDALFEHEKPFIILDDPFVNLDDLHTEQAMKMLKKIAKIYQVIYLVCNSSRCENLL